MRKGKMLLCCLGVVFWISLTKEGCYKQTLPATSIMRMYSCDSVFDCQLFCSKNRFKVFSMKNTSCICLNSPPSPASRSTQEEDCSVDCNINVFGEKCGGRDVSSVYEVIQIPHTYNTSLRCMTTVCSNSSNLQIQADDCDKKLHYFCQLGNGKVRPVYIDRAWSAASKWCRINNNTVLAVNTSSELCSSSRFQSFRFWRGEFRGLFRPHDTGYDVLTKYTKICQYIIYSGNIFKTIKSSDCEEKHSFFCQTDYGINSSNEGIALLQTSYKNASIIKVGNKASFQSSTVSLSVHFPASTVIFSTSIFDSDVHGLTKYSQIYSSSDQYNSLNFGYSSETALPSPIIPETVYSNASIIRDEEMTASLNMSLMYFTDIISSSMKNVFATSKMNIVTRFTKPSLTNLDSVNSTQQIQLPMNHINSLVNNNRTLTSHINRAGNIFTEQPSNAVKKTSVTENIYHTMDDKASCDQATSSESTSINDEKLSVSSISSEKLDVLYTYSITRDDISHAATTRSTTIYHPIVVYDPDNVDLNTKLTTETSRSLLDADISQMPLVSSVYEYSSLVVESGTSDVIHTAVSPPLQNYLYSNFFPTYYYSRTSEVEAYTDRITLFDTDSKPIVISTNSNRDHVQSQIYHQFTRHNSIFSANNYQPTDYKTISDTANVFNLKPSSIFAETMAQKTVTTPIGFHSSSDIKSSQSDIKQGSSTNLKQINTPQLFDISLNMNFHNTYQSDVHTHSSVNLNSLSRVNDKLESKTKFDNMLISEHHDTIVIHPSASEELISVSLYPSENINSINILHLIEYNAQTSVSEHRLSSSQGPIYSNKQTHQNEAIGSRKTQIVIISIVGAVVAVLSVFVLVLRILILRSKVKMRKAKRKIKMTQRLRTVQNIYEDCVEGVFKL